jgi:hypothetical protein
MKLTNEHLLFFKKSFLFLIIIIMVVLTINELYISLVLPRTYIARSESSYIDYLKELPDNHIQNAFFGDSHVANSINPEYLPNTFNFGTPGENYIKTYYRLKKIINQDKVTIENAFIQVDTHSFSSYMNEEALFIGDSLWYYHKLMPFRLTQKVSKKSLLSLFIESKLPVIGHAAHFSYIINGRKIHVVNNGWISRSGNFSENPEDQKEQIASHRFNQYFTEKTLIDPVAEEYFEKIILLAEQKNITLFFIRYPVTSYCKDSITSQLSVEEIYPLSLNKTLQKNFLDYEDLFLNNHDLFTDSNHLNYFGAEKLSKKIRLDLNITPITMNSSSDNVIHLS